MSPVRGNGRGAEADGIIVADRAREIFTMGFEFFGQEEEGIDKSQSLYSAFAKIDRKSVV